MSKLDIWHHVNQGLIAIWCEHQADTINLKFSGGQKGLEGWRLEYVGITGWHGLEGIIYLFFPFLLPCTWVGSGGGSKTYVQKGVQKKK